MYAILTTEKLMPGVYKVAQWTRAIYRRLEDLGLSLESTVERENWLPRVVLCPLHVYRDMLTPVFMSHTNTLIDKTFMSYTLIIS